MKLEKYRRQQQRAARNRRIILVSGIVGAASVVALLVAVVVLAPQRANYSAGGDGVVIEGVESFENTATHVETPVTYAQSPPAGGEHSATWLNCGEYTQPVPNENAVHALEHGAIWVTYDGSLSAAELETLRSKLPSTYVILSPFGGLPSPIVLSGWNRQLTVDSAADERIPAFFEEYWKASNAPEPGAPCTGAFDGPGKAS
ncbi:DUF3105 domain-containing protein [Microbacterium maritypicum]